MSAFGSNILPRYLTASRAFHTVFDVEVDVYLLQGNPHAARVRIREHDEFGIGWCFVIMQLILARPVANEAGSRLARYRWNRAK